MPESLPPRESWDTRLEASFCAKCRKQFVPIRIHCSKCRGRTDRIFLEGKGKLKTFTVLWVTPEGFTPPLVLGICELGSGLRVLGEVSDYRQKDSLALDEPVQVTEKDQKYFIRLERAEQA